VRHDERHAEHGDRQRDRKHRDDIPDVSLHRPISAAGGRAASGHDRGTALTVHMPKDEAAFTLPRSYAAGGPARARNHYTVRRMVPMLDRAQPRQRRTSTCEPPGCGVSKSGQRSLPLCGCQSAITGVVPMRRSQAASVFRLANASARRKRRVARFRGWRNRCATTACPKSADTPPE
jgi:hypothetical protein